MKIFIVCKMLMMSRVVNKESFFCNKIDFEILFPNLIFFEELDMNLSWISAKYFPKITKPF